MALGVGQDQASPAASTHRRVVELEGGGQHLGFLVVVLLLIQLLPEPRLRNKEIRYAFLAQKLQHSSVTVDKTVNVSNKINDDFIKRNSAVKLNILLHLKIKLSQTKIIK